MVTENVYAGGTRRLTAEQAQELENIKSERKIGDDVRHFTSYSGCDIRAVVSYYDSNAKESEDKVKFKTLGDIQTITYSTHREKFPVRTLGRAATKGYTRGPRTIGGTVIFTVFDKEVLSHFLTQNYQLDVGDKGSYGAWANVLIDQIPPFDITINFVNEYGSISKMVLFGVELINEGQTMSIDDLITENVVNFVARHIEPMVSLKEPQDAWIKYRNITEDDFEKLSKDTRVKRLLAAMEAPREDR